MTKTYTTRSSAARAIKTFAGKHGYDKDFFTAFTIEDVFGVEADLPEQASQEDWDRIEAAGFFRPETEAEAAADIAQEDEAAGTEPTEEPVVGEFTHCPNPKCGTHLDNGVLGLDDEIGEAGNQTRRDDPETTHEFYCMGCGHEFGPEFKKAAPRTNSKMLSQKQVDRIREMRNTPNADNADKCAYTHKQVADEIGTSAGIVSQIARGKTYNPDGTVPACKYDDGRNAKCGNRNA